MRFIDWIMTGMDWEEASRISLYRKIEKKLETMTPDEIEAQIQLLQEIKLKKEAK